ncbi:hypothetical protein AGMMS49525_15360 [Bacteroidia bacterium]|nr:hypothetical protein AGMMS49525_15360 [Bacteroidia bacterium]
MEITEVAADVTPIIAILKDGFSKIKELISNYTFESKEEEITFFKETKPKIFFKLIYYHKILEIERHRPVCGYEDIKEYFGKKQKTLNYFFHKNNKFIQCYRSGSTHLDELCFLRSTQKLECHVESFSYERDSNFSTNYDYKVTEILANDMLATYLDEELEKLERNERRSKHSINLTSVDKWTERKVALVELVYDIYAAQSVNNGNIDLRVLTAKFCKMFNIDIDNAYRIFLEIRSRKGDRTPYLNHLIESLNKYMTELDSK